MACLQPLKLLLPIGVRTGTKVLSASEAAKFLPNVVFFRGQSAPIQARNSGGVQFAKDALLLISLVDTAGYSSSVQERYQAYLITETAIDIEGHRLEPGAYGCGFSPATPSWLWTLAATTCLPSALPKMPICGDPLLCRCCHRPELPDTVSTLAVTLLILRLLPQQQALRMRDCKSELCSALVLLCIVERSDLADLERKRRASHNYLYAP